MESRSFIGFVSTAVKVLSHQHNNDLFELMQNLYASKEHENLMFEILCVRKLLDAHINVNRANYKWEDEVPTDTKKYFEERMMQNTVSGRTLFYIWNLFKDHALDILEYLDSLEAQNNIKCNQTDEFCLNYLGVRRLSNNRDVTYLLLNPDAKWVKNIDKRSAIKHGNVVSVDTHHFVSAARNYWLQELPFVGIKVLGVLEFLRKFSREKSLFMFCQSCCLKCISDIAQAFNDTPTWKFQNFVKLCLKYFDIVFPLDSRASLSESVIFFRRSDLSESLLKEVITSNSRSKSELSYGQIGRVVMIWLGSGEPKSEHCRSFVQKFPGDSSWKEFVEILSGISKSNLPGSSCSLVELIQKFHQALGETYSAKWSVGGYMSANCFMYLMERLLILASQLIDSFITSKSSFVEWLIYHESCGNSSANSITNKDPYRRDVFDFLISVVDQLLSNRSDTEEWIESCNLNLKYYYPLLMLRLFQTLSLLCLNSGTYSVVLYRLLSSSESRYHLPRKFRDALQRGTRNYDASLNVNAVADAFISVGNPLVIVNLGRSKFDFVCPSAIFIDMGASASIKEVWETLFQRSTETSHGHSSSVEETIVKSNFYCASVD